MTREEKLDWLYRLRSEIDVYMPKEWINPMNNALDMSIKALEQELKTGHWIALEIRFESVDKLKCSECGQVFVVEEGIARNYCPNCGAKMIESEEEE